MAILYAFLGTLITFLGTALGSAFVFFTKKECGQKAQRIFLGFASGVMLSACIWSLLLPASDYASQLNLPQFLPLVIGFLLGSAFLALSDKLLLHMRKQNPANSNKNSKLFFAVTLHNFPEGMAVGLSFALATRTDSTVTMVASIALAIGIAVQNIPEGAIISLPLVTQGNSKTKSFFYGALSGIIEPLAGVLGAILTTVTMLVIPWTLAFSAGAMFYVVIDELLPTASKSNKSPTLPVIVGFALMMLLDIALS